MSDIIYIDRLTCQKVKERIYGNRVVALLYGKGVISWLFSSIFLPIIAKCVWPSRLYGAIQHSRWSQRKIRPFIQDFEIDPLEFASPIESFNSFNDFFIRKLKKDVRPMAPGKEVAVMPADARYLVFPNITQAQGFWVKGKKFTLSSLLQDKKLSSQFEGGAMVMARLCPSDYHRFHFPCDGVPGAPHLINGALFSVNPLALRKNIDILTQNKRVVTQFQTQTMGMILYVEVGATSVGSIHQTFEPHQAYQKGAEKGYFSFGGSCLILLFQPNTIVFDPDLVEASSHYTEVRGLLGQSLGILQMGH